MPRVTCDASLRGPQGPSGPGGRREPLADGLRRRRGRSVRPSGRPPARCAAPMAAAPTRTVEILAVSARSVR